MAKPILFVAGALFLVALSARLDSQARPAAPQTPAVSNPESRVPSPEYVGSSRCGDCHRDLYVRWSKTRMANVVTDPKVHPEVIIPDFNQTNPALTFTKDQIAFVYGTKWKQRYFRKVGDDYFPLPAQWDVQNRVWRPYFVAPNTDWWVAFYPPDNMKRPTGPLCDGCHSVNYDIARKQPSEWNVGCERCHGPGSEHARDPRPSNIVNPARLDFVRANDTCIQCHSQGKPLTNPIEGQYYDWPVGFRQGLNLKDFWELEEHKLGETTFTHFADGSAHKNRMQGNDFVQSVMYERGVTCFSCHDVHGTPNNADLVRPARDLCLTCHGPSSPNGPHAASVEAHTHHERGSRGGDCVACHMPQIAQTIADVNVRSHTFKFITPAMTDQFNIPNPCLACHRDQNTAWVRATLRTWDGTSPWRVN